MAYEHSYRDLLSMKADLDKKIEERRMAEMDEAIAKVHALVKEFSLTQDDVFPVSRRHQLPIKTVAPKYKDPVSGGTWTGRGKPPLWIKHASDRSVFAIPAN